MTKSVVFDIDGTLLINDLPDPDWDNPHARIMTIQTRNRKKIETNILYEGDCLEVMNYAENARFCVFDYRGVYL